MAVAAATTEPLDRQLPMPFRPPLPTPPAKKRLPAGRPASGTSRTIAA